MTGAESEAIIQTAVRKVAHCVRRRRAEFYGLRGLFCGTILALFPLLLREHLGVTAPVAALFLALAGSAAGAVFGFVLIVPLADAARLLDRTFDLKDRVATALEWMARPNKPQLVTALSQEAASRCSQLDLGRAVRRRVPYETRFFPFSFAAGLLLFLIHPVPISPTNSKIPSADTSSEIAKEEKTGAVLKPQARIEGDVAEREFAAERPPRNRELTALFKESSLGSGQLNFATFLNRADERLKMLQRPEDLPDLKQDVAQTPSKQISQRMKSLLAKQRANQIPLEKLRELLEEIGRFGGESGSWQQDIEEGEAALEEGEPERALGAIKNALSKIEAKEQKDWSSRSLRGGKEPDDQSALEYGDEDLNDPDFDQGEGNLPGTGTSLNPKGRATPRLKVRPHDVRVPGQIRTGPQEQFDIDLLGPGTNVPSELPYLSVYSEYKKIMEEALAKEEVPRDYQAQVKEYFRSLFED